MEARRCYHLQGTWLDKKAVASLVISRELRASRLRDVGCDGLSLPRGSSGRAERRGPDQSGLARCKSAIPLITGMQATEILTKLMVLFAKETRAGVREPLQRISDQPKPQRQSVTKPGVSCIHHPYPFSYSILVHSDKILLEKPMLFSSSSWRERGACPAGIGHRGSRRWQ